MSALRHRNVARLDEAVVTDGRQTRWRWANPGTNDRVQAGGYGSRLPLARHFTVSWDPYFKYIMTVADVYRYPTQHYDHHRRQLTTPLRDT
jgi:hypothetical protein